MNGGAKVCFVVMRCSYSSSAAFTRPIEIEMSSRSKKPAARPEYMALPWISQPGGRSSGQTGAMRFVSMTHPSGTTQSTRIELEPLPRRPSIPDQSSRTS